MGAVQKQASLHEKAVQAVARGEVETQKTPRRRGRGSGSLIDVTRVHPELLAYARRVTGGDMSRVRVSRDGSITIINCGKSET